MDVDFIIQDSFSLIRPQWKLVTDFEEAGRVFADLVRQNYKVQGPGKTQEPENVEEASSEEDGDDEEAPAPDMDIHSSGEEAEAEVRPNTPPRTKDNR